VDSSWQHQENHHQTEQSKTYGVLLRKDMLSLGSAAKWHLHSLAFPQPIGNITGIEANGGTQLERG